MSLESLVCKLQSSILTEELLERSKRDECLEISGGNRTVNSLIIRSLAKRSKKPLLLIVPTLEEATRWSNIFKDTSWDKVLLFPTSDKSPYELTDQSTEITRGQLSVISELIQIKDEDNVAIVTTHNAIQAHLPPKNEIKDIIININKGDIIDLNNLSSQLSLLGYQKSNTTDQEGLWSRRGDIIDIFNITCDLPVRIELYGDQVDKIREYDPISQRSLDEIKSINISPISINQLILHKLNKLEDNTISQYLNKECIDNIRAGIEFDGMHILKTIAWPNLASIIEYISRESLIVISEKEQCELHSKIFIKRVKDSLLDLQIEDWINKNIINASLMNHPYKEISQLLYELNDFNYFEIKEIDTPNNYKNNFNISTKPINVIPNQFGKLTKLLRDLNQNNYSIWIYSAQPSRVVALLEEHDCLSKFIPNAKDIESINRFISEKIPIAIKALPNSEIEGINLAPWKIALLTDKEIFGQQNLSYSGYIRRKANANSKKVDPNKLHNGDYVVHRNHGIGKFIKIEKLVINHQSRDYLLVEYTDGTLRVAADQLNSLARYRSSNETPPKINKMGGKSWLSIKERARKAINKIAIDIVKLYAERETAVGYAFPKDGPWQSELEDSFQYIPTPDQLKAFKEVKEDMEKEKPMDRLICGDVGYGKTEVAIRSIFKAITAGKQVALLAPTTVLSQQHWRTISSRFAPYPIKTALLNRFKSTKEKKEIANDLQEGKIDAIIGTHQVLSKNINFKDLGLLVIDEEQRFGVNQKEKIKQIKKNVDVLTLTATPIPRTLYMSMSGVREISLITTPPPLRRAIKTHLIPKDDEVIRSAISQEIERGGQIFYVVPRIEGIDEISNKIRSIFPNIKILIAHGQMLEGALESTMVAFNAGEADLLLCTTIIESGLDIPRVNTILIEDSHKFGLSQLYQLRGRVGRSGVQAHAWLFFPKENIMNENSRNRLKAIQEFSELGSGYQLAMRDMEIRGVGNIIGTQQSGQIEAIGFDLYMEILQEAISEMQGQSIPLVEDVRIDLPITAFIPNQWIVNNEEKLAAYKAVTGCNSKKQLQELVISWNDRYGQIPQAVNSLIELMELKIKTKTCGFYRIKRIGNNITLETLMEEGAFLSLRKGIPKHIQTRFIYKKHDTNSEVTIRGLGVLPIEKQIETLKEWLTKMEEQIAESDNIQLSNILE